MPYISSFERYLLEKGFQEGKQEGKLEGKQEAILEILALKNNVVPEEIQQKIRQITDTASLQSLLRLAILKQSLKDFRQELNKFLNQ